MHNVLKLGKRALRSSLFLRLSYLGCAYTPGSVNHKHVAACLVEVMSLASSGYAHNLLFFLQRSNSEHASVQSSQNKPRRKGGPPRVRRLAYANTTAIRYREDQSCLQMI